MLTDLQRKKLTRYFHLYDSDGDGAIGPGDFERVVENVRILQGLAADSQRHQALRRTFLTRWERLRACADADRNGRVDLSEWLGYWDGMLDEDDRYQAEVVSVVRRLFDGFDRDEDGYIGLADFADLYSVYGLSSALARSIFTDLDANHDGMISRQELVDIGHHFYRGDDPGAPGNRLFGPYD
jgi:hypothetical protein